MAGCSSVFIIGLLAIASGPVVYSFTLGFNDIRDIMEIGRDIYEGSLKSLEFVQFHKFGEDAESTFPLARKMEKRIMDKIKGIDRVLGDIEDQIDQRASDIIDVLLEKLPQHLELKDTLKSLDEGLTRVDVLYHEFQQYSILKSKYSNYTRIEFAKECISPGSTSLPAVIKLIHRLVIPESKFESKVDLFQLLASPEEAESRVCDEKQSPQQLLYNLYSIIVLTELRAYAMMQFSYGILETQNNAKNEFAVERNMTKSDLQSRIQRTLRAVKVAMAFAPRDLWRCDPRKHEEDKTFTQLTQVFQGYIVNEVDLNPGGSCRENCGFYSISKVYGCYDNLYCAEQRRCNGKVLKCQYFDSDMWICPSENKNRRYEYIQYENGNMFGKTNTCTKPTRKVDSWWRWLFWHCSYCMCYCDDYNNNSDRHFSLRDVTSDVSNNKIITGLRFVKVNQIIHIQIQEGELMPRGQINNSSISWKPVDNFSRTDVGVTEGEGHDYHTLTWEKRGIDLDDLSAPEEHLLTGMRFRMIGSHLNLEIRVTPFNFTNGTLIRPLERSEWKGNDNTEHNYKGKRTEVMLNKPDIPTRAGASARPDSKTNQFLHFGPTDLHKDAAQTTVPFLDIQPVLTDPPFPLSGAGVFHKGRDGSGGYVALKVITYDFTKHLHAELPPEKPSLGDDEITNDIEKEK